MDLSTKIGIVIGVLFYLGWAFHGAVTHYRFGAKIGPLLLLPGARRRRRGRRTGC